MITYDWTLHLKPFELWNQPPHKALSFDWANIIYTIIQDSEASLINFFTYSVWNVVWPPSPRLFLVKSHLPDVVLHPSKPPNRSLWIILARCPQDSTSSTQCCWKTGWLDLTLSILEPYKISRRSLPFPLILSSLWCDPEMLFKASVMNVRRQVLNGETTNQIRPLDNIPKDPD